LLSLVCPRAGARIEPRGRALATFAPGHLAPPLHVCAWCHSDRLLTTKSKHTTSTPPTCIHHTPYARNVCSAASTADTDSEAMEPSKLTVAGMPITRPRPRRCPAGTGHTLTCAVLAVAPAPRAIWEPDTWGSDGHRDREP